jgi:hypothetical protein
MPTSHILFFKKKIQKKKKEKTQTGSDWPKGRPNHPLGHWGWFGCSQPAGLGVAEPPLGQTGWPATTYGHPSIFFFWFFFLDFFF